LKSNLARERMPSRLESSSETAKAPESSSKLRESARTSLSATALTLPSCSRPVLPL
jgi:hypothetical protein